MASHCSSCWSRPGVGFLLKGNVDKLQAKVSGANAKIAAAEGNARTDKNDAEKVQKEAKEATGKLDELTQTVAAKSKEAADAATAFNESKLIIAQKDEEIAKLKAQPTPRSAPTRKSRNLQTQLAEATTQKDNAIKERDEAKTAFDGEVAKAKENEVKLAELQKKERARELNYQKPGLQGRILAGQFRLEFRRPQRG
ncbi:MAG: hypothetical protein WDN28_09600 [Chthoniobacter sp.]